LGQTPATEILKEEGMMDWKAPELSGAREEI